MKLFLLLITLFTILISIISGSIGYSIGINHASDHIKSQIKYFAENDKLFKVDNVMIEVIPMRKGDVYKARIRSSN